MAFLDATYVNNAIGTSSRIAFCGTATGTGSAFAQFEAMARAEVQAAAKVAGYTLADTSTNAAVQRLALGQWYFFAGGFRKGLEVPPAIADAINRLQDLREGNYPLPGLTPSARDAIGGVKFSSTSETATNGRVQYFSRSKLRNW